MRLERAARLALALAVLASAAACPGEPEPAPSATATPAVEPPDVGGTLRVVMVADVDSLDPHRAARPASWFFARAMHRGLLAFSDAPAPLGAQPVPDLAAALPAVSAGGLRYTFRVRDGVSFGAPADRPITAHDVKASIERLVALGRGIAPHLMVIRGARAYVRGAASAVSGIVVPDDRTVRIRLTRPVNDLPWLLAHPQVAVVPAGLPPASDPSAIAPAGPYRLATYRPERAITLERNPAWRRGPSDPVRGAFLDGIRARIGMSAAGARAAVLAGNADLVVDPGPPDPAADPPPAPPDARTTRASAGCVRYLFVNRTVAPFGDGDARVAVAHAVRRARLASPGGGAARRILPPTVLGHRTAGVLAEDLGRSRAALARANRPSGFGATLVVGDSPRDRREARAVRSSLARAGIRIVIRRVPPAILAGTYQRGVGMGIATWCADWPGLAGRGVLGAVADPLGYARIRSRAAERAIDAAATGAPDQADRLWARADLTVLRTASIVPLTWPNEESLLSGRLRGLTGSPMWPRGDPAALWVEGG